MRFECVQTIGQRAVMLLGVHLHGGVQCSPLVMRRRVPTSSVTDTQLVEFLSPDVAYAEIRKKSTSARVIKTFSRDCPEDVNPHFSQPSGCNRVSHAISRACLDRRLRSRCIGTFTRLTATSPGSVTIYAISGNTLFSFEPRLDQ
jgi:hypothetical protein